MDDGCVRSLSVRVLSMVSGNKFRALVNDESVDALGVADATLNHDTLVSAVVDAMSHNDDIVAAASAFTDVIAKGLQSANAQSAGATDSMMAVSEALLSGVATADILSALSQMHRACGHVYDLSSDKRYIAITGVLGRASHFAKVIPQLVRRLSRKKARSKTQLTAGESCASSNDVARRCLPSDAYQKMHAAPKKVREKFSEIQALLKQLEEMEQCLMQEASAVRAQMRCGHPATMHQIATNTTALAQLTIFFPLALTASAVMDTMARPQPTIENNGVPGASGQDFFLMEGKLSLIQRLTDRRLLGWTGIAMGAVCINFPVMPALAMGLCGVGSALVVSAAGQRKSQTHNRDAVCNHSQFESTAAQKSMLHTLANFVAAESDVFQQHVRELGIQSALTHFGDEIEARGSTPSSEHSGDEDAAQSFVAQARDLACWMTEWAAGTVSPRPCEYGKIIEATRQQSAHAVGRTLDTLIEALVGAAGSLRRDEAFHLKTAIERFQPKVGFTYERRAIIHTYGEALERINQLLAADLDRIKYAGNASVDEANVAHWSSQDTRDIEQALAQGCVRLNNAVLPSARQDTKMELSNHVFAALRQSAADHSQGVRDFAAPGGEEKRRGTLAKLIGRVVTASGSRFDQAMRADLEVRLGEHKSFDAEKLFSQAATRIQWTIREGRFIVACKKDFQWNDPASGKPATNYECRREVIFDIQSARFVEEFYHVRQRGDQ